MQKSKIELTDRSSWPAPIHSPGQRAPASIFDFVLISKHSAKQNCQTESFSAENFFTKFSRKVLLKKEFEQRTYPVFKRILTLLSLFPVFHLPSWSAPTISRFFDGRDFPRKNWTSQNFITLSKSVKITRFSVSNILLRSLPLRSQLRILKLLSDTD